MQSITLNKLTWVMAEEPKADDISFLQDKFDLHPLILGKLSLPVYRPQFSEHKNYFFAVIHFPIFGEDGSFKEVGEVDILVNDKFVVTTCSQPDSPVEDFFRKCNKNLEGCKRYFNNGPYYLLLIIINNFLSSYFPFLDELAKQIEEIEEKMFKEEEGKTLKKISILQRDIIEFRRIIKPQISILRSIFAKDEIHKDDFLNTYAHDIIATNIQIWNTLENYWETINALHRTNNTLLSYKLNRVIYILTAFSITFIPANLVAFIFGMNVEISPVFRDPKMIFLVMIGAMSVTAIMLLTLMKRRS